MSDEEENGLDRESRCKMFLEEFASKYPRYELVDYVQGTTENAPILLAGIARNLDDSTVSTLFVVDENGVGQLGVDAGYHAIYRADDGIRLSGNVILLSLDVYVESEDTSGSVVSKYSSTEIRDFKISVVQDQLENGQVSTGYTSEETIREDHKKS